MSQGLFAANEHSKYKINWKPVSLETVRLVYAALRAYDSQVILHEVLQVDEWEKMSNNFQIDATFCGERAKFLVRKNIILTDRHKLQAISEAMQLLREADVRVPRLMTTFAREGEVLSNESFWQVFQFVPGDHFSGSSDELRAAAHEVGRMHRALAKIPESDNFEKAIDSPSDFLEVYETALTKSRTTTLGQLLQKNQTQIQSEFNNAADVRKKNDCRVQLIHGDIHPLNFLFSGTLRAILDFGNLRFGPLLHDVGNASHRLVRQVVVQSGRHYSATLWDSLKIFFDSYNQQNPLTDVEMKLWPVFAADLVLQKLRNTLSRYNRDVWSEEVVLAQTAKFSTLLQELVLIADLTDSPLH